jgi:hypothetical protein
MRDIEVAVADWAQPRHAGLFDLGNEKIISLTMSAASTARLRNTCSTCASKSPSPTSLPEASHGTWPER